jgi:hypothetical protein
LVCARIASGCAYTSQTLKLGRNPLSGTLPHFKALSNMIQCVRVGVPLRAPGNESTAARRFSLGATRLVVVLCPLYVVSFLFFRARVRAKILHHPCSRFCHLTTAAPRLHE